MKSFFFVRDKSELFLLAIYICNTDFQMQNYSSLYNSQLYLVNNVEQSFPYLSNCFFQQTMPFCMGPHIDRSNSSKTLRAVRVQVVGQFSLRVLVGRFCQLPGRNQGTLPPLQNPLVVFIITSQYQHGKDVSPLLGFFGVLHGLLDIFLWAMHLHVMLVHFVLRGLTVNTTVDLGEFLFPIPSSLPVDAPLLWHIVSVFRCTMPLVLLLVNISSSLRNPSFYTARLTKG